MTPDELERADRAHPGRLMRWSDDWYRFAGIEEEWIDEAWIRCALCRGEHDCHQCSEGWVFNQRGLQRRQTGIVLLVPPDRPITIAHTVRAPADDVELAPIQEDSDAA